MNRKIRARAGAIAVLLISATTYAQTPTPLATDNHYTFKGDRLGMTLGDFKAEHHEPGVWVFAAGGKKEWNSALQCKAETSAITTCFYNTTIASIPANANETFIDGKLATISLSFTYGARYFSPVLEALNAKLGAAKWSVIPEGNAGPDRAVVWDNDISIAELQPHVCSSPGAPSIEAFSADVALMLQGKYCSHDQFLSYGYSRVLFVDKESASKLPARIAEGAAESRRKANGDL
jgi:hypothetical protein